MKRVLPVLLLLCATGAQAQLYKWVGPDGKVSYSDVPPAKATVPVEKKPVPGGSGANAALPYELAEAVKQHPVTLYTAAKCTPCDDGRVLLIKRGIPFTEKTVTSSEDMQKMRQAGGDKQLPLLVVGRNTMSGFETTAWSNTLTSAGYPVTSILPKNYQQAAAEPAAPAPPPKKPEEKPPVTENATPPEARPAAPLPPTPGTPPGFRF